MCRNEKYQIQNSVGPLKGNCFQGARSWEGVTSLKGALLLSLSGVYAGTHYFILYTSLRANIS